MMKLMSVAHDYIAPQRPGCCLARREEIRFRKYTLKTTLRNNFRRTRKTRLWFGGRSGPVHELASWLSDFRCHLNRTSNERETKRWTDIQFTCHGDRHQNQAIPLDVVDDHLLDHSDYCGQDRLLRLSQQESGRLYLRERSFG